jgi:peptidoglycan hydrolase-like protein with peptidoglycan-binding domain
MRRTIRQVMYALAAVTASGGLVLGQSGAANAAQVHPAAPAALSHAAAPAGGPAAGLLRPGTHGAAIRKMQLRLAQLHYFPGPVNGVFDADTLEAVWAFKEVQGIQTVAGADDVGITMQRALARPRLPKVLVKDGGPWRVEVNLASEVLVLYHASKVELISHISAGGGYYYPCPGGGTCGPAITPDGDYRAHSFVPGWLTVPLGEMYNPVFFIGEAYAIHGETLVPLQPVSHGCVRVPMDIGAFFHGLIRISQAHGTPIYIVGHAPGT